MVRTVVLNSTRDCPSDNLSIRIKRICIKILLTVHTMEINPYLKDKYPNFEVGLKCIIMVF